MRPEDYVETTHYFCRCGAEIFETDPGLSRDCGYVVWSHVEDTGCDDPVVAFTVE